MLRSVVIYSPVRQLSDSDHHDICVSIWMREGLNDVKAHPSHWLNNIPEMTL